MPETPLSERATEVCRLKSHLLGWLSNQEFLCSVYVKEQSHHEVWHYDLPTQRWTPETGFNRLFSPLTKQPDELWYRAKWFSVQISPDGNWLLMHHFTEGRISLAEETPEDSPDRRYVTALSRDGTRQVECWQKEIRNPDVRWLADSRHWIEKDTLNTTVTIYSFSEPGSPITLPVRSEGNEAVKNLGYMDHAFSDGRIFVPIRNYIGFLRLASEAAYVRQYRIPLPERRSVEHLSISPDGKRIAWYLAYWRDKTESELYYEKTGELLSKLELPARYEIWICQVDGSDLSMIGHTEGTEFSKYKALSEYSLTWLPDNQHLSFIANETLYTTPAD